MKPSKPPQPSRPRALVWDLGVFGLLSAAMLAPQVRTPPRAMPAAVLAGDVSRTAIAGWHAASLPSGHAFHCDLAMPVEFSNAGGNS